jgi:hypothetical protein
MLKKSLITYIAVFFFVFTCNSQKIVKLHGLIKDSTFSKIEYFNYLPCFNHEIYDFEYKAVKVINKQINLELKVSSPQLKQITPPGYSWSQTVLLTPGD